jgi:hypothetical protein
MCWVGYLFTLFLEWFDPCPRVKNPAKNGSENIGMVAFLFKL